MKIEVDKKILTVVLAPLVRMNARGLTEQMLKPGATVSLVGFQSKQTSDELRAESLTIDGRMTDLR